MSETVRATQAFTYWRNGEPVTVRPGDELAADDPAVKGRAHRFEPVEVKVSKKSAPKSVFVPPEVVAPSADDGDSGGAA